MSHQFLSSEELAEDELATLRAKKEQKRLQDEEQRRRVLNLLLCRGNPMKQAAEIKLCEADPIYFINKYCYTYDPREPFGEQDIPFCTYEYQNEFVEWLCAHIDATILGINKRTMLVEKSRDMGASWVLVALAVWYWLFKGGSIHFGSRILDEADCLGDTGSLLEKVRFILKRLPAWILPTGFMLDKHMKFGNIVNPVGGQITAEAASPEFGRGDRKTFIVMDEFASWEEDEAALKAVQGGSTNALILISTPKGPFNRFAKLANPDKDEKIRVQKKRFHWSQHPVKRAGMRKLPDGTLTSHWFREQTSDMTPEDIASEIEIKYETSTKGLVFPDFTIMHRAKNLMPLGSGNIGRVQDPGVHWFYLMGQIDKWGRALIFQEHYNEQAFVDDIAWKLKEDSQRFKGYFFDDVMDPNGERRQTGGQESSEVDVMREKHDIDCDTSLFDGVPYVDKVTARITLIHQMLRELCPQTQTPRLLIDEDRCPILVKALSEGYRYKVNKQTKQVSKTIHEIHPYEDAVDCLGMFLIYKFGMPGSQVRHKKVDFDNDNVIQWNGQLRKRSV